MGKPMGRRPGRATTREDILRAAYETVVVDGVEQASMRRIAAAAGVDPAIIYRHFRGKDDLLDAVVRDVFVGDTLLLDAGSLTGRDIVRQSLRVWDSPPRRRIGIAAVRGALADDAIAALLRQVLTRTLLRAFDHTVSPDHRDLRAALISAQIVGIAMVRHRVKLPGLVNATPAELERVVGPVIEHYLRGDLGLPPDA